MAHVRWFIIVIELIERLEWLPGAKNVMVEVPLDVPELIFSVDTSGNGEDLIELFQGISFGFLLLVSYCLNTYLFRELTGRKNRIRTNKRAHQAALKLQLSIPRHQKSKSQRYSLPAESTLRSKGCEQPWESQRHDKVEKPSGGGGQ